MNEQAEKRSSVIPESPDNLKIKAALAETLGKARAANIDLYLTGGTAAAVYAGETRPLSLDLDFFVHPDAKERIVGVFGGKFEYFSSKKLFKSVKLVGAASNGVDLDFIAEQNIVPDESRPEDKITLSLNDFARKKACEGEFMGERVMVLPPELIVIAKLFAGRGIDLKKYDLADSQAVIESGMIRNDIMRRAAMEIAGSKREIRELVINRLLTALQKLDPTDNVRGIIETFSNLETGFDIEQITEATRRRTIPDKE